MTRRQATILAGAGLLARNAFPASLTARRVIERIQQNSGVPWQALTVDNFKAGNPDANVTGIATTVMSTFQVLQKAAAAGKNLIISHEPTFYSHEDQTKGLIDNPVFQAKQNFIEKHNLVVWRFHDHLHARKPDAMLVGLAEDLGWRKYQVEGNERRCELPATTLGAVASHVSQSMKLKSMRVVGNAGTPVTKVGFNPGYTNPNAVMKTLEQVDLLICGEMREWEGVEYTQDLIASGKSKALIILGHAVSEDPGMRVCAAWLKTFITEVPVEWVPAGEPFWTPK